MRPLAIIVGLALATAPDMPWAQEEVATLSAEPATPIFRQDDPLRFRLRLTNISGRTLRIRPFASTPNDMSPNFSATLYREGKQLKPLYALIHPVPIPPWNEAEYYVSLAPGETMRLESGTGLTLYDNLVPGRYTATIQLWNDHLSKEHDFTVRSKPVEFDVVQ